MTTQDLANRAAPGELATVAPIDEFQLLDPISGGLVAPRQQQPTLATISAGYNANTSGKGAASPVVSRDGTIYVDGSGDLRRAFEKVPGLARALQATDRKRLTIAFPFDDPALFVQQRFARYSASALEVYGDHTGLTRIYPAGLEITMRDTGEVRKLTQPSHQFYPAGSEEFTQLLPYVKTSTSLYFLLAEWDGEQPLVTMPDGLGLYRLRMTSRNSIHNILNALKWVSKLTGGRFAGMPFDLWHDSQEVVGPDGKKRNVPVWQIVPRPPRTVALSSGNFKRIFTQALEQGKRLRVLPAPAEDVDLAIFEGPAVDDPDEAAAQVVEATVITPEMRTAFNGAMRAGVGLCDPEQARRRFFGHFKGSLLAQEAPRQQMLREYTQGRESSLSEYLKDASDANVAGLLEFAERWLKEREQLAARPAAVEPAPAELDQQAAWTFTRDEQQTPPAPSRSGPASGELPANELAGVVAEVDPEAAQHLAAELEPEPDPEPLPDFPPTCAATPSEPENLDLLEHSRQRLAAIERAETPMALNLAWHDYQRDRDAGILSGALDETFAKARDTRQKELDDPTPAAARPANRRR